MTVADSSPAVRTPTPIDAIAEKWVETLADLAPTLATYIGLDRGKLGEWEDFSPAGHEANAAAARAVRASVARLVEMVEASNRDEAGAPRGIATRALEASFAAREASRVFEALAKAGPSAADRLRSLGQPDNADIERVLGSSEDPGRPSRLQPAA